MLPLVFCIVFAYGQNEATKRETVEWIKSRVDYFRGTDKHSFFNKIELIKYDYEADTLFYKVQHFNNGKAHDGYRIDAIPLKDINPDRIRVVDLMGDDGMGIELYTNNGGELIKSHLYRIGENSDRKSMTLKYKQVTIFFPKSVIEREGTDLPSRTVKALTHLIKLAGGQGEKF